MILAGCGGPSSFAGGPAAPAAQGWILPDAKHSRQTFFVSDLGHKSVDLFSLRGLKLEGVVTGFDSPRGMCSDAKGNVWVTDLEDTYFAELSHTGTLLQRVEDNVGYPIGCAVSPTNGDLAVANWQGFSFAGNVLIYKHATGNPTMLSCESIVEYYFLGYDNHGVLYVDGLDNSNQFQLCSGGNETGKPLSPIQIEGQIYYPGMVQWYTPGKYLAVGDDFCGHVLESCIYKVSISGNVGTVIGSTRLLNHAGHPVCALIQGVIGPGRGIRIFGGDYGGCTGDTTSVDVWAYPAGGIPKKYFDDQSIIGTPYGAAISTQP